MKAIVLRRYGSPLDLALEELPKPVPRAGEVLVKVRASSVNDWDWAFVRGKPHIYRLLFGLWRPKVTILGAEVAGTIEACGQDVERFEPGDDVYGDISEAGFGAFAEYLCVREEALCRKPARMTFEQAAALPHAAMLALQGLIDVGQLQRGERVLINGAGGGVGTLGVQIAKQHGAEVTGVDAAHKLDTLRAVGFDHVIDYRENDFTKNGERYDLILDTKTNRPTWRYLRSLRPGGRYVTVGGAVPWLLQALISGPVVSAVSDKRVRIVALKPNADLDYVNELFEAGGLECVIDGTYPLRELPQALQRFGEAKHVGKVVIDVAGERAGAGT